MQEQSRVAILIDTSSGHGRGLLNGMIRFQREIGSWSVIFRSHKPDQPAPAWLQKADIDGVLARIPHKQMADILHKRRLPVIDMPYTRQGFGFPCLFTDNQKITELAAQHLLDRGIRHFGFCGWPRGLNSRMDERCDLFVQTLADAGCTCSLFPEQNDRWDASHWENDQQGIAEWLMTLPKPAGVMACYDDRGQHVLEACQIVGLKVPDEVAVIGSDNDDLICKLSSPPLTSIDAGFERIGYEAASLLEQMMKQGEQPEPVQLFPPARLVQRQSTNIVAVEDQDLAAALRFIRDHASQRITVEDILAEVPISRSSLERRMKKFIGRTPKEEILRVQLERVQQLLAETQLSLTEIAFKTGFDHPHYLAALFKRKFQQTPGSFRRAVRK